MRKLVSMLLATLMLLSFAVLPAQASGLANTAREKVGGAATEPAAEATAKFDLQSMTEDELRQLIQDASAELESRAGQPDGSAAAPPADVVSIGSVLYEDENLRITMNGEPTMDEYGVLSLGIVIENFTDRNLIISLENASCNGWDVSEAVSSVSAGGKSRDTFDFYDAKADAELSSAADVETIKGNIRYFDEDDFEFTVENSEFVIWNFQ